MAAAESQIRSTGTAQAASDGRLPRDQEVAKQVALTVLAAARAEVGSGSRLADSMAGGSRQTWADVPATFMNA